MDPRRAAISIGGRAFADLVVQLRRLGCPAQSSSNSREHPHAWLEFEVEESGGSPAPRVVSLFLQPARDPQLLTLDIVQPGRRVSQLFAPRQLSRALLVDRVRGLHQRWAGAAETKPTPAWDVPFSELAA